MNVAVVGASGFTGLELLKMLIVHPEFEIAYVANTSGDCMLTDLHPSLEGVLEMEVEKVDPSALVNKADLAFLALPHKESMRVAKELLTLGIKVVDLSADYRLKLETYELHYCAHVDRANLSSAVYGLPEYSREAICTANLVANPGCYPTAALLGILPFVPYLDRHQPLFIDAKSGVSGAGKKCVPTTHFSTINDNMFAYNPMVHRHAPEIAEKIQTFGKEEIKVNFIPHLIPVTRGMLVSMYGVLDKHVNPETLLHDRYDCESFIRLRQTPPDLKSVAGTHFVDLFVHKEGKSLYVCVSIDNLLRGASSQALVNANLMCGFSEEMGIPKIAYMP
jgi:N-acetyl-gamma-glutamyl-phosphate reductase